LKWALSLAVAASSGDAGQNVEFPKAFAIPIVLIQCNVPLILEYSMIIALEQSPKSGCKGTVRHSPCLYHLSASPTGGPVSTYVHTVKRTLPCQSPPKGNWKEHTWKSPRQTPAARDLDSQSTATKHNIMPHTAAYNSYGNPNVSNEGHGSKSPRRHAE